MDEMVFVFTCIITEEPTRLQGIVPNLRSHRQTGINESQSKNTRPQRFLGKGGVVSEESGIKETGGKRNQYALPVCMQCQRTNTPKHL